MAKSPRTAALAAMSALFKDDVKGAQEAIEGLSRDDVYSIKWYAENLIAVVMEKFDSMPEE